MLASNPNAPEPNQRQRCYACFRPVDRCFCDRIPAVENKTHVVILQHFRERFHPFNTARILRLALQNSQMVVEGVEGLGNWFATQHVTANAALLYPGKDSQLLETLSESERPQQLVVLDGTWHHTKTLFRDIPKLQSLRKVRLAPAEPSRYGIRREPHVLFLSTLEATVAALRCLEPDTKGFDQLVAAFHFMVESQLAHPKSEGTVRRKLRPRAPLNIPKSLRQSLRDVVVFYAETSPHSGEPAEASETERAPAYWVAERLVTGERLERAIASTTPMTQSFLNHIDLTVLDFDNAISLDEFREQWNAFLRPTDTVAYYYSNCTRLMKFMGETNHPVVYLKAIQLHRGRKNGEIDTLLSDLEIVPTEARGKGRPGRRLSYSIALVQYLATCSLFATD